MTARYRVIYFVPSPLVGERLAIGAVADGDDRVVVARAGALPHRRVEGAAAHLVRASLAELNAVANIDVLPTSLGPQIVAGPIYELPTNVVDVRRWLEALLGHADQGSAMPNTEARLAALATLDDGWLDNAGVAIAPTGLAWLTATLTAAIGEGLPLPHLYPTPDGNVQAEWSFAGTEVSALFDASAKAASCVGVHTRSGAHREEDVRLLDADGVTALVRFVTRFAG